MRNSERACLPQAGTAESIVRHPFRNLNVAATLLIADGI